MLIRQRKPSAFLSLFVTEPFIWFPLPPKANHMIPVDGTFTLYPLPSLRSGPCMPRCSMLVVSLSQIVIYKGGKKDRAEQVPPYSADDSRSSSLLSCVE